MQSVVLLRGHRRRRGGVRAVGAAGPRGLAWLYVVGGAIGLVASLLGTGSIGELNLLGFIVAVIAATLLVGVAEGMSSGRRGHA